MGRDPKRCNQRWKCAFHEKKGHKTNNYNALKSFLDQLVQARHLKEYADQVITKLTMPRRKTSPSELSTWLGPNHPDLENRIMGEIRIIKQMHEVLSVQSAMGKRRQCLCEPGSITFTKADIESGQHPTTILWSSKCRSTTMMIYDYDVKQILVDLGSSVEVRYYDIFKQLKLSKVDLKLTRAPLVGFNAQSH